MLHQEFEPPEALRDTIKCFWYDRRDLGSLQSSFEVLPDGYAEIIFHFGSPCSIFYNGSLQPLPSPFIMGLLNQPVLFYTKNRLEGYIIMQDFDGEHPLVGHSVPNFAFEDGAGIGELMHDGQGILLDFDRNASLKTLAGEYGDRIKYISGSAKDRLGVSAVLIRPDGIIVWASDSEPDCSQLQMAAARWFVCNAGAKDKNG